MAAFKDMLLGLSAFPDPTPDAVVDFAIRFSRICGARISATVPLLDSEKIVHAYSFGERLAGVPGMVGEAIRKGEINARRVLDRFEERARAEGVFQHRTFEPSAVFPSADFITQLARLHDIALLPVSKLFGLDELYYETVIFGSGRPTLIIPESSDRLPNPVKLESVVVAWDFSRTAARTLADAMPLLEMAKDVRVVTVTGEKAMEGFSTPEDLRDHLKLHGIDATLAQINADGRPVGVVLADYAASVHAEILVMGAFGHSRLLEFVLGGATRCILSDPPLPVFFSH